MQADFILDKETFHPLSGRHLTNLANDSAVKLSWDVSGNGMEKVLSIR